MSEEQKSGLWYLVDSRKCESYNLLSPNVNNKEESLLVYESMAMALLKHKEYRNSHVYEVSIEDEEDVESSITRGKDTEFDEEEAINFLESVIFPEKGNKLRGYLKRLCPKRIKSITKLMVTLKASTEASMKDLKKDLKANKSVDNQSEPPIGYKVKKVRVHREILSVCYVTIDKRRKNLEKATLNSCFMKRLFPSLKELQKSIKNYRYNRYVFEVHVCDILELYKKLEVECSYKIGRKIMNFWGRGIKKITPKMVLDGLVLDKFNPDKKEIYKMNLGTFDINEIEGKYRFDTRLLKMEEYSNDSELYLRDP